jgi:hypothetical protein
MKRLTYILVGAVVAMALGFLVGSLATNWYSDHWAKSDDDINSSVLVFFVLWPFIGLVGGALGNRLYKRNLTLPSSGHPKG